MDPIRRGWTGDNVRAIQERLLYLGFYKGPVDGLFGGGTEAAVRTYQSSKGIGPTGMVGDETWAALFEGVTHILAANPLLAKPLAFRCLALTGTFETGTPPPDCFAGISGDFNGQGLSLGVCQWCIGQGSLQPLLTKMDADHHNVMSSVFGPRLDELRAVLMEPLADQLAWVRSIQSPRCNFFEPWAGYFKALGRTDEFQQIEQEAAANLFSAALQLCRDFGLVTERAVALMFDIKTQNGSISPIVKAQILRDFSSLPGDEVVRMQAVANRRADAAKPQWAEDVRRRKLAIANGDGMVHGKHIDLDAQFGIRLQTAVELV